MEITLNFTKIIYDKMKYRILHFTLYICKIKQYSHHF